MNAADRADITPETDAETANLQTILVVDDAPDVLLASRRALRAAGYQVITASTTAEADAVYEQGGIALVILDVNLPDGNGVILSNRWKSRADSSAVPVILRSAVSVSAAEQALGLESGADGYLTEPIEPEVLVATVRAHLRIGELIEELDDHGRRSQDLVQYALNLAQASRTGDVCKQLENAVRQALGAREALLVWNDASSAGPASRFATAGLDVADASGAQMGGRAASTRSVAETLADRAGGDLRFVRSVDELDHDLRPELATGASWAVFPFVDSELSGVMVVEWDAPQEFDEQQQDLLRTFGYLTAISLARAWAVELNRSIADALQEALMPPLSLIPKMSVARRTHIAAGATLAGGDWFDAFPVGDAQMIVCGDVVGHGAPAAGTSGLFRHSLRTLLYSGVPIGEALMQLDDLLDDYPVQSCGTVIVAQIDPHSRIAEVASAGHLPPVVIDGDQARVLECPPGPMLGFGLTDQPVARTTFPVGERTQMIILTDGVLEDPDRSLAESYDHFVQHLNRSLPATDEELQRVIASYIDERVLFDDALFAVLSLAP